MPEIIIDTSVLIALEKIDLLQILCKIYKEQELKDKGFYVSNELLARISKFKF